MAPNRYISAGTQYAFFGFVDTAGNLLGSSVTAPANGSGSNMIRLLGIQQANPGPVEGEDVNIEGDDGSLGKIEFGPGETPSFVITLGAFDLETDAKLQSTLVETIGDIKLGVLQPNDPTYPDGCLIIQAKSKSKDGATGGAKSWSGYIIPLASVQPLGREEYSGRTAGANRLRVTTQVASKKNWGVTITEIVNGTNGAPLLPFTSDNPIAMARYTGTGAGSQTFTLDPLPVSLAKTIIVSNTAVLTPTTDYTVNTTTGLITFVTNPPAGSKTIILYEVQP